MTLKQFRRNAGLTQQQLADVSGVNKTQISKIEREEIKIANISLANAVALAKALNIQAEDLLDMEICNDT